MYMVSATSVKSWRFTSGSSAVLTGFYQSELVDSTDSSPACAVTMVTPTEVWCDKDSMFI